MTTYHVHYIFYSHVIWSPLPLLCTNNLEGGNNYIIMVVKKRKLLVFLCSFGWTCNIHMNEVHLAFCLQFDFLNLRIMVSSIIIIQIVVWILLCFDHLTWLFNTHLNIFPPFAISLYSNSYEGLNLWTEFSIIYMYFIFIVYRCYNSFFC